VPRLIFILLLVYAVEQPLRAWLFDTFRDTALAGLAQYTKIVILIFSLA